VKKLFSKKIKKSVAKTSFGCLLLLKDILKEVLFYEKVHLPGYPCPYDCCLRRSGLRN
jgi:hypothetical protein